MEEVLACISLGSNLGDRKRQIEAALTALTEIQGCRLDKHSKTYETAPWGQENQPGFLNAACGIWCTISAADLLTQLQKIEARFGRIRNEKWGPRTLDLDIICFGQEQIQTPKLSIPHPLFDQRRFVLEPLADIYPDLKIAGKTVATYLSECAANDPTPES